MNYSSHLCQELKFPNGTNVQKSYKTISYMNPSSQQTLIANLKILMNSTGLNSAEIAKKSGLSKRMIDYLLKGERGITVESMDLLANAFNLNGWHLLIEGLDLDAARSGRFDKLVSNFNKCDKVTQEYLAHTANKDAISAEKHQERPRPHS